MKAKLLNPKLRAAEKLLVEASFLAMLNKLPDWGDEIGNMARKLGKLIERAENGLDQEVPS